MNRQNQKFTKPLSMGANVEGGYFSDNRGSGLFLSSFNGRLQLKFWKTGENSGQDRNNTLSMDIRTAMVFNGILANVIMTRNEQFKAGQPYDDLEKANLLLQVGGYIDNAFKVFGTIQITTTNIDGIPRVTLKHNAENVSNVVVLADSNITNIIPEGSGVVVKRDIIDTSFLRFCNEVNEWINFSAWQQAAANRLYNTMVKGRQGGGNSSYRNNGSTDNDMNSPIFDNSDNGGF